MSRYKGGDESFTNISTVFFSAEQLSATTTWKADGKFVYCDHLSTVISLNHVNRCIVVWRIDRWTWTKRPNVSTATAPNTLRLTKLDVSSCGVYYLSLT